VQQVAERLLALAEAQGRAIEAEDFELFVRLTDERADLQHVVAAPVAPGDAAALRAVLERVADLDRRHLALVQRLREATLSELHQLRRGQGALGGYARPGAALDPAVGRLDERR